MCKLSYTCMEILHMAFDKWILQGSTKENKDTIFYTNGVKIFTKFLLNSMSSMPKDLPYFMTVSRSSVSS